MARVTHVKSARQRYEMVPVIDPDTGLPRRTLVTRRDGSPKLTKTGQAIYVEPTVADRSKPLPMPTCENCGAEIAVGAPYKWVAPRSGPYGGRKRYRCGPCPTWRPSELSSSKMAPIMAAQEELDLDGDADDLAAARDALVETIREVAAEYEESADNMEDGFGHETYTSTELREKSEALNDWADELEGLDLDAPTCDACSGDGTIDDDECDECGGDGVGDLDELRDSLDSLAGETPV